MISYTDVAISLMLSLVAVSAVLGILEKLMHFIGQWLYIRQSVKGGGTHKWRL